MSVDWTQPIELDDGTPLIAHDMGQLYHVDIKTENHASHPAFPGSKWHGSARRDGGLVISNHKYHVRNRTMTLKIGDRVRYSHCEKEPAPNQLDREGKIGTVKAVGTMYVEVTWDDGSPLCTYGISPHKLTKIDASRLDAMKPLQLVSTYEVNDVKLLGRDEGGDLIVDISSAGKSSQWMVFDQQGNFVRSAKGGGFALKLRNKPEEIDHAFHIVVGPDGKPYFSPTTGPSDIEVIIANGKVIKVKARAGL